jgi:hypothetical protein
MTHDLGSMEVRHKEAEEMLRDIGRLMKQSCPPGYGFAFFLFTYGEGGNFFYISSADREGIVNLLEEFIVKLKGN